MCDSSSGSCPAAARVVSLAEQLGWLTSHVPIALARSVMRTGTTLSSMWKSQV